MSKQNFYCDANKKDKLEITATQLGLHVAINTEDGDWSEVYFERESALALVQFITNEMGLEQ